MMNELSDNYSRPTAQFEKLRSVLSDIRRINGELEHSWLTESGKLYEASLNEALVYIEKIISDENKTESSLQNFSF